MVPGKKSIYIPEDPGLKQLLLVVIYDLVILSGRPTTGVTSQEHVVVEQSVLQVCVLTPPPPLCRGETYMIPQEGTAITN